MLIDFSTNQTYDNNLKSPAVLKSFSVYHYRNLNVDKINFKNQINLFIGSNNSGKSNLIDAISFSSRIINSDKRESESAFLDELNKRNWGDILNRKLVQPDKIKMEWVLDTSASRYPDLSYSLEFMTGDNQQNFYITDEHLRFSQAVKNQSRPFDFVRCHNDELGVGKFSVRTREKNRNAKIIDLKVNPKESVFRQIGSLLDNEKFRLELYPNFQPTVKLVQETFADFHTYSSTAFDLTTMREAVDYEMGARYMARNGANLINVLLYLDEKYNFIDQYTEIIRELIPELERIKVIHASERKRSLRLIIDNSNYQLYEMSDGTIKAMIMALLIWSPEPETIIAMDEPEINIHPAWLKVIANWMLRASVGSQWLISTHSPDFLDPFTEAFIDGRVGVFVFDTKRNQQVTALTPAMLQPRLSEGWELGDLYRVGDPLLGGWPW